MDLSNLNGNTIRTILKRVNLQTLMKVRKVNKFMDNLVENSRSDIRARYEHNEVYTHDQLVLRIRIHAHPKTIECGLCRKRRVEGEVLVMFYVINECTMPGDLETYDLSTNRLIEIHDPFLQLSAVHFDHIMMTFDPIKWTAVESSVYNKLLSTFHRFKFSCDWMFSLKHKLKSFGNILKLVNFTNFWYIVEYADQDISSWPIQHCKEVLFTTTDKIPSNLLPVLPTLKKVSLSFKSDYNVDETIKNFLKTVVYDRKSRGILKEMNFSSSSYYGKEFHDVSGIKDILRFRKTKNGFIHVISKLAVDGGFAYIYFKPYGYALQFYDQECDYEAKSVLLGNGNKDEGRTILSELQWNLYATIFIFSFVGLFLPVFIHFYN